MGARNYNGAAAASTLSGSIASGTTSIPVTDGSTWPTGSASYVIDRGLAGEEKILATRTGNTLTASNRGYDGTSAGSHNSGATIEHVPTAVDFSEANAHVNASAAVHGLTGTVVGTTDSQTLTNKGVNLASNTVTGTTAQFNTALSDNDFATLAGAETLTNKALTGAVADATSTIGGVSGTTLAADRAAWTSFTPTINGITIGNGTVTGRYRQVGKTVNLVVQFVAGTTTVYTGGFSFNMPGGMTATTVPRINMPGEVIPSGSPYQAYAAWNGTNFQVLAPSSAATSAVVGADSTHPAAWSTSSASSFTFYGTFEVS